MGNPRLVCAIERLGDLNSILKYMLQRKRTPQQSLLERFALQVLNYQKIDTVLLTDVV